MALNPLTWLVLVCSRTVTTWRLLLMQPPETVIGSTIGAAPAGKAAQQRRRYDMTVLVTFTLQALGLLRARSHQRNLLTTQLRSKTRRHKL